jgi:protein-tyrosine-phosphatase
MMDRAGEQDIPDPIGGTYDNFKQTYEQLKECIAAWLPSLQTKHAG